MSLVEAEDGCRVIHPFFVGQVCDGDFVLVDAVDEVVDTLEEVDLDHSLDDFVGQRVFVLEPTQYFLKLVDWLKHV